MFLSLLLGELVGKPTPVLYSKYKLFFNDLAKYFFFFLIVCMGMNIRRLELLIESEPHMLLTLSPLFL